MATVLLILVVVLVLAALVFGVVSLLAGDDPGLGAVEPDGRAVPLPNNRSLTETDLKTVRFDLGWRGYRMAQVDRVLRRTAYDVGYKDEMIAVLEAEVMALRDGRAEDAELLRKARESAANPAPANTVITLDAPASWDITLPGDSTASGSAERYGSPDKNGSADKNGESGGAGGPEVADGFGPAEVPSTDAVGATSDGGAGAASDTAGAGVVDAAAVDLAVAGEDHVGSDSGAVAAGQAPAANEAMSAHEARAADDPMAAGDEADRQEAARSEAATPGRLADRNGGKARVGAKSPTSGGQGPKAPGRA